MTEKTRTYSMTLRKSRSSTIMEPHAHCTTVRTDSSNFAE